MTHQSDGKPAILSPHEDNKNPLINDLDPQEGFLQSSEMNDGLQQSKVDHTDSTVEQNVTKGYSDWLKSVIQEGLEFMVEVVKSDNLRTLISNILRGFECCLPMLGTATLVRHFMECPADLEGHEQCIDDETDDLPFPPMKPPELQVVEDPPIGADNPPDTLPALAVPAEVDKGKLTGSRLLNGREILEICNNELSWPLIGVLLSPLILLAGYVLYDWYKARRLYFQRKAALHEADQHNTALQHEINRLEAYSFTFHMARLLINKERVRTHKIFTEKTDNIRGMFRQFRALKEERSILQEVLRRVNSSEENKIPN